MARRASPVAVAAGPVMAGVLLLSACGGGSTTASSSSSASATASSAASTPTADASVDACVVGTWTSVSESGTATMPDGTSVSMSGGSGVVDVVKADGTVHDDYSSAQPEVGTSSTGVEYDIVTTGTLDGGLAATNGSYTIDPVNPQTLSQMITRPSDNTSFGPFHPPAQQQTGTYQCTQGTSLAVTSGGVTVTYKPSQ